MARNAKSKRKRAPKTVLKLPDLEQSKSAVLNSLTSPSSQRSYDHAIREFIDWYCSEPRLAFNKTVVTRYRISLEQRQYAPSTINLRLAAVRRLAYEAADCGLLSPDLAAGIRRGGSPAWRSHRQSAHGRRRQTHDRRIWCISSKTAQEPRHDCCFNRMRSQKGGGCCSEIRGCPTPGRTLGDCRSEWKRRSHPHRSDAKLGEDGDRRMGDTCWNQFRSALSSHQQSGKSVGKRFHAEGDLVHRERGSRQLRSGGPCST
jgi:hypothetical protein